MDAMESVRRHVIALLTKAEAHTDTRSALEDFPQELRGRKPPGAPHSPWQLLEHMRIAQWDILRFSLDAKHVSPEFPQGYWPANDAPPTPAAWDKSVEHFFSDLDEVVGMVRDPKIDVTAKIPHGEGQTYLREALLVADHNAYHLGQLVTIRRILERK